MATELFPAVTTLDKALWYGAWVYSFDIRFNPDIANQGKQQDMMYKSFAILMENR